ncbi:hypothetical protein QCA50_001840 [Cerrena zonata]|uniref:Uncharacterized protein n=1 Tax=Cerrena zonata TaxID=2478898 RepID=A0AAW0GVT9_9APHY
MAEFIQALDPSKLVLLETGLSFLTSAFEAPVYNLPIFLFGLLSQESNEAVQSLRAFTFLAGGSIIYDIIWMARHDQHWFIRVLTIFIQILKIPTVLAFAAALRQRGGQFSGLSFSGNDIGGATVWSMPGGFTSGGREGYQSVEDPIATPTPKPALHTPATAPPPPPPNAPGAYQSV